MIVLRPEDAITKAVPKSKSGRKSLRTKKKQDDLRKALLLTKSNATEDIGIASVASNYQSVVLSHEDLANSITEFNPLTTSIIEHDPSHPEMSTASGSYSEAIKGNLI